jgi:hypothetical protein
MGCFYVKPNIRDCNFCVWDWPDKSITDYLTWAENCHTPNYGCFDVNVGWTRFDCGYPVGCWNWTNPTPCGFNQECERDNDTYIAVSCGGNDCNDDNRFVHPGAPETECNDGIDNDCDEDTTNGGTDCRDRDCYGVEPCVCEIDNDSDGHYAEQCGGDDCHDDNPLVWTGHGEICDNGIDDDCDENTPLTGGRDCDDFECLIDPHCQPSPTPTPSDGGIFTTYYCSAWYLVTTTWYCAEGSCTMLSQTWLFIGLECSAELVNKIEEKKQ